MEFLTGTKKILRYLDAYTRDPLDLGFTKITSRFIEFFAFISMLVTTIPIGVFCYLNRNSFKIASAGVLYFIANSSIKIIYLALLVKRKSVIEAIDHLQQLIQTSKIWELSVMITYLMSLRINKKFSYILIGIRINPKMTAFYVKRDEANNRLTQNLLRSGIYTVLFFFLPNAMPPFTHFLLGWPSEHIWNFPFPVVYVFAWIKIFSYIFGKFFFFFVTNIHIFQAAIQYANLFRVLYGIIFTNVYCTLLYVDIFEHNFTILWIS